MPDCNSDGCSNRAAVKIVGEDGYEKAYRCRGCLKDELHLTDTVTTKS